MQKTLKQSEPFSNVKPLKVHHLATVELGPKSKRRRAVYSGTCTINPGLIYIKCQNPKMCTGVHNQKHIREVNSMLKQRLKKTFCTGG